MALELTSGLRGIQQMPSGDQETAALPVHEIQCGCADLSSPCGARWCLQRCRRAYPRRSRHEGAPYLTLAIAATAGFIVGGGLKNGIGLAMLSIPWPGAATLMRRRHRARVENMAMPAEKTLRLSEQLACRPGKRCQDARLFYFRFAE
jgi:hypothetical protein